MWSKDLKAVSGSTSDFIVDLTSMPIPSPFLPCLARWWKLNPGEVISQIWWELVLPGRRHVSVNIVKSKSWASFSMRSLIFPVLVSSPRDFTFRRHICTLLLVVTGSRLMVKSTRQWLFVWVIFSESLVPEISWMVLGGSVEGTLSADNGRTLPEVSFIILRFVGICDLGVLLIVRQDWIVRIVIALHGAQGLPCQCYPHTHKSGPVSHVTEGSSLVDGQYGMT